MTPIHGFIVEGVAACAADPVEVVALKLVEVRTATTPDLRAWNRRQSGRIPAGISARAPARESQGLENITCVL